MALRARKEFSEVYKSFTLLEVSSKGQYQPKESHPLLYSDLKLLMQHIYPNPKSVETILKLDIDDLKTQCAHAILFGAIQTRCITCWGILCHQGHDKDYAYVYMCLNTVASGSLKCRPDRYHDVDFSPWKIPTNVNFKHPDMERVMNELMHKYSFRKHVSHFSISTRILNVRNMIVNHIHPKCLVVKNIEHEIYKELDGDIPYSYFIINRPDASDGKYGYTQILVRRGSQDLDDDSTCVFKIVESIYGEARTVTYETTLGMAIVNFKDKFHSNTGMTWSSWCQLCKQGGGRQDIHAHCFYSDNLMFPLQIDYQKEIPRRINPMLQYAFRCCYHCHNG